MSQDAELHLHGSRAAEAKTMAGHWSGGPGDDKHLPEDTDKLDGYQGGRESPYRNNGEAQGEGEDDGKSKADKQGPRAIRRASINTRKKRVQYLHKLESIIKKLDMIVEDPENFEPLQIMAINSMTKNLHAAYTIIKDVNVEELESDLRKFEEEIRKIKASRGERRVEFVPEPSDDPKGHD